ncbi:hypothetical protein GCM10022380_48710 [Amycolatopsis tucumanensis]|uniref:Uncharacterized protein n=1 Tax=Amycolatopsis tucumanensis TaxID=401106 RepID=A0ABP7IQS3_9PSEU
MVRLLLATGAFPLRRKGNGPAAVYEPLPEPVPEGVPGVRAERGRFGRPAELREARR